MGKISLNLGANYMNPPIPKGYRYVEGLWHDGFVTERISDGSKFTWIPVASLPANGTLDGYHFDQKFGRRKWNEDTFLSYSYKNFRNGVTDDLWEQKESIERYGGFYFSSHKVSKGKDDKIKSVALEDPFTVDCCQNAYIASSFENSNGIKSHFPYNAEVDTVNAWLIQSGVRTVDEVAKHPALGDNSNYTRKWCKTGSREEWMRNRIYDVVGNGAELDQDSTAHLEMNYLDGYTRYDGDIYDDLFHNRFIRYSVNCHDMAFRIVLCIAPDAECTYLF